MKQLTRVLDVACPVCRAPQGQLCRQYVYYVHSGFNPVVAVHPERRGAFETGKHEAQS